MIRTSLESLLEARVMLFELSLAAQQALKLRHCILNSTWKIMSWLERAFMTCSRQPSAATAKRKSVPAKRASPRKTRKSKKALEEEAAAAEALSNADSSDDGIASEAPSTDIPGWKASQCMYSFMSQGDIS